MQNDADPRADLRFGTTSRLLTDTAHRLGGAEALVEADMRLTYAQLDKAVSVVAAASIGAGLVKGDRVALWAPNSALWVIAALGLQRAGGVLVPLNTRFLGEEAAFILQKSQAKLLFTTTDFLGRDYPASLAEAAGGYDATRPVADLPALQRIVTLSGPLSRATVSWNDFLDLGRSVADADVEARANTVMPDDLSDILFTSGTTGRPKGAMCTHGQTLRAYAVWNNVVGLREGDRYLIVNPFFHGFGYKAGWLACILAGATILPLQTLDVPTVLELVRTERITVLPGTPTLFHTMLEHPAYGRVGVETLRLVVTGAANVPAALLHRIRDEVGFEHIVTGYGLTESCAIVSMSRYTDPLDVVASSAGQPLPGVEVRIVAPDGAVQPAGCEGEIVVRGYTLMRGYLDEPAQTAATIDAQGWLHTGDIGLLDEYGRVHVTDRLKDMFIVGGFNAYPAEIEQILSQHPDIAQVAVIGVPDDRMGEVGAAFVIARKGRSITADDVVAFSRANMANYKAPRHVHIVDELPLNASGKVLKNELRARVLGAGSPAEVKGS
ncbi:MAG: HIP---CoA ligase [Mycobacterium sp.]|jgi:acyl-CoA synthetase (AMP-forming)/AMP-acid ligase II|nr:HIP---CoA ligase [Mycobacterium sp.]MDT5346709.1 HIP---CoA ligase [Mycobacterium sp.]